MIPVFVTKWINPCEWIEIRLNGFMNSILDFFFPPRCLLCGVSKSLVSGCFLCKACEGDLKLNQNACVHCGIPLDSASLHSASIICGQCQKSPPNYDCCWSAYIYAQPLEWMIQQLKFNAKLAYVPLLSELMIHHIPKYLYEKQRPDVIIPMPLHANRIKQRGFNQSLQLVKPLAKLSGLKLDSTSCQRQRDTEHQTGKNARQRHQNIKGAFTFSNDNNYKHVVIFDDVVTTGSSISELSKTLKQNGVNRVDVWCLARAEKIN